MKFKKVWIAFFIFSMVGQIFAKESRKDNADVIRLIEAKNELKKNPKDIKARLIITQYYIEENQFQKALDEIEKLKQLGASLNDWTIFAAQSNLGLRKIENAIRILNNAMESNEFDKKFESNMLLGDIYLAMGEFKKSFDLYEKAQVLQKSSFDPVLAKTKLFLLSKENSKSETLLNELEKNLETLTEKQKEKYYFYQAEYNRTSKRFDLAKKNYLSSLSVNESPAVMLSYASFLLERKDMSEFERISSRLSKRLPNHPRVNYYSAVNLIQQKKLTDAINLLEKSTQNYPEFLPNYIVLARVYFENGQLELADKALLPVLASTSKQSLLTIKLAAGIKLGLNDPQSVIELLSKQIRIYPNDIALKSLYAKALIKMKKFDAGLSVLQEASKIAPTHPILATELALAYLHRGESSHAQAILESLEQAEIDFVPADFLLALTSLDKGDFDRAEQIAQELGSKFKDQLLPKNLKGLVAWASGDLEKAQEIFEELVNEDPKFVVALNNLATIYLQKNEIQKAQLKLEQALKIYPDNLRALILSAQLSEREGRIKEARSWYKKASERNSENPKAQLYLVSFYIRNGEIDKAYVSSKILVDNFPDDVNALSITSEMHFRMGNYTQALETFVKLKRLGVKKPYVYLGIAKTAMKLGDFLVAKQEVANTLALSPGLYAAKALEGYIAFEEKRINDARNIASQLIKINSEKDYAYKLLGLVESSQNHHENALSYYMQAYKRLPNINNLNDCYISLKKLEKFEDGVDLVELWLKNHPNNTSVRTILATDYLLANKNALAKQHFLILLSQNSQDLIVLNNLANLYLHDMPQEALSYAERAYRIDPNHPFVADTYAQALIKNGKIKKALPIFETALKIAPDQNDILLNYASGLIELEQFEQAQAQLEKCQELSEIQSEKYQYLYNRIKKL